MWKCNAERSICGLRLFGRFVRTVDLCVSWAGLGGVYALVAADVAISRAPDASSIGAHVDVVDIPCRTMSKLGSTREERGLPCIVLYWVAIAMLLTSLEPNRCR